MVESEIEKLVEEKLKKQVLMNKINPCGLSGKQLAKFLSDLSYFEHACKEEDWAKERWEGLPFKLLREVAWEMDKKCGSPIKGLRKGEKMTLEQARDVDTDPETPSARVWSMEKGVEKKDAKQCERRIKDLLWALLGDMV